MSEHKAPGKSGRKTKDSSKRAGHLVKQLNPFRTGRSSVMTYNPITGAGTRKEPQDAKITMFNYKEGSCHENSFEKIAEVYSSAHQDMISWIDISGLRRKDIQELCDHFGIHQLAIDDILSMGQRAKMDELGNSIFCLMPMMYFNEEFDRVDREQVSLILGKNVVLTFQEDPSRDVFDVVRGKLRTDHSRLCSNKADFLYYSLLDAIVDDYFMVMEKLGAEIEDLEDVIIREPDKKTLAALNHFRREVGQLRRTITPVRELINGMIKTESDLIQKKTKQYFKDVYDHILQANETAESYRDLVMNLQGLYLNQVNLKMNEVMKVLAVVTALFAPLTLIAGIYGMNFDNMPELHTRYGYFISLGAMLVLFCGMLYFFKKRGWF